MLDHRIQGGAPPAASGPSTGELVAPQGTMGEPQASVLPRSITQIVPRWVVENGVKTTRQSHSAGPISWASSLARVAEDVGAAPTVSRGGAAVAAPLRLSGPTGRETPHDE